MMKRLVAALVLAIMTLGAACVGIGTGPSHQPDGWASGQSSMHLVAGDPILPPPGMLLVRHPDA